MTEPFKLFYDGQCPLCQREAATMRRLDKGRGRLELVDYRQPGFDPGEYGLTLDQIDARIHAVTPDGRILTGMDVFRHAYRRLGLGWLIAPTGWPLLRPIFDTLYRWFARNRHRLTGRCDGDACRLPR
jgi:predicted DCC family thiol-disulfide oxidoreductase YuxK